jgi:hypothetical protein
MMRRTRLKPILLFVACMVSALVTLSAGLDKRPRLRAVEVLQLFAGGAVFGAALAGALLEWRRSRGAGGARR